MRPAKTPDSREVIELDERDRLGPMRRSVPRAMRILCCCSSETDERSENTPDGMEVMQLSYRYLGVRMPALDAALRDYRDSSNVRPANAPGSRDAMEFL